MKRKIIILLTLSLLIIFVLLAHAEDEYEIPSNFNHLKDLTYDTIYRYVEVNEDLFYDIYLMDESFLGLSAILRGQVEELSLAGIKDYYQKSLKKYDIVNNFIIMVTAFDLKKEVDFSDLTSRITITNSQGQSIHGEQLEQVDQVFVISFPKAKILEILQAEEMYTIQIEEKNSNTYQAVYQKNYQDGVPEKITELIEIIKGE